MSSTYLSRITIIILKIVIQIIVLEAVVKINIIILEVVVTIIILDMIVKVEFVIIKIIGIKVVIKIKVFNVPFLQTI